MVDRVEHGAYHKIRNNQGIHEEKPGIFNKLKIFILKDVVILTIIGFVIGRVSILNMLAPFGVSFLLSVLLITNTKNVTIIGIGIIAGLLTRINGLYTIQSISSIMLIFLAAKLLKFDSKTAILKVGAAGFVINFSVALLSNFLVNKDLILYESLMGLFNSTIVMALVYIYNYALPIILERRKRKIVSSEEIVCISIMCSIIISGLSDIVIYGVSIKIMLSVFIILVAAYGQGAGVGAAIGTTVGLITCISSDQVPVVIGTYAFCGLLSGIFKDMGKIGSSVGFIIADVIILFYLGGKSSLIGFKELIAGIVLFAILPASIINSVLPFGDVTARDFIEQQSYVERMKDLIRTKIMHITDVFSELSKNLGENKNSETMRQNVEINTIINSIVDKTCTQCDARNICWNRDFYCTYQNMFDIVDVIQADGSVEMETVPADLKKKCLKVNQLIKAANYMFDIYKMNYKWRMKIGEGKKIVLEQLSGIAGILNGLSEEIRQEVHFKGDIEEELAIALDKEGIEINDVVAIKDKMGKYEVNIYKRSCLGKRECIKDIGPVVSGVLKRKMKRDRASCMIKEGTNLCYFKMVEAVKYQISTGVAREIKDEGGLSGDNYSFIELNDGKYMLALSDGMGTGPTAALESNCAITLLEKYLEAGFDRATALKAINSVMALKSNEDSFTTMDLAIADLYTGELEIIKVGAVSTFIKRADGQIETISTTTLPIGILSNLDIESKIIKVSHGDMLVMITDGVQEAGSNEDGVWIVRALEEIESRNPQQVAEELTKKAKERNDGNITDDMTVLVSKIWEVI